MTPTDCPVCVHPGMPPSKPSHTVLDVYRCLTVNCPVLTFHPFEFEEE